MDLLCSVEKASLGGARLAALAPAMVHKISVSRVDDECLEHRRRRASRQALLHPRVSRQAFLVRSGHSPPPSVDDMASQRPGRGRSPQKFEPVTLLVSTISLHERMTSVEHAMLSRMLIIDAAVLLELVVTWLVVALEVVVLHLVVRTH